VVIAGQPFLTHSIKFFGEEKTIERKSMNEDISRNFSDLVRDAREQSEKALYPHLKLHIFGPYHYDCYAYLTELKLRMQEKGFNETAICDDRNSNPPRGVSQEEEWKFWFEESKKFLQQADVAVFVFLDHIFERESLPERSRRQAYDVDEDDPKEINSSVSGELIYWLTNQDMDNERTLVLFEEGIYEEIGPVITGATQATGVDFAKIPNGDVHSAIDETRQRSTNWVMGELRNELLDRYYDDVLE
jgi:hypothetical protein